MNMVSLRDHLTALANHTTTCDECNRPVRQFENGDVDAAYQSGIRDGQIKLAQALLEEYFPLTEEEVNRALETMLAQVNVIKSERKTRKGPGGKVQDKIDGKWKTVQG